MTGTFTEGGNGVFDPLDSSFSLIVTLPTQPTVTSAESGADFFINLPLDYQLNGQSVASSQSFVEFINAASGGGLGFYITDDTGDLLVVRYFGNQLYNGDEIDPMLLNTALNPSAQAVALDNLFGSYFPIGNDNVQIGDPVPEPSTFWLPGTAALAFLLRRIIFKRAAWFG